MIDSDVFVQGLQDLGVNFFTGVPDSILTYEANRDRGFVFIESRNLAPRFQDRISDTAD